MKKILELIVFVLIVNSTSSYAETYEVFTHNKSDSKSMTFEPIFLKVALGDIVKFVPKDKGHTSKSVFTPSGAQSWKGNTSQVISVTMKKEGVYIYECQNHGIMGMAGIIQVGNASNITDAKEFFFKRKKKFIMHKNRLDDYINKIK